VKVVAVIPARLGSRRFSGKVLHPFRGQPLLYYVWRDARRARKIDRLLIATDSSRVAAAATAFGADVMMTAGRHRTGSDRVAEVMQRVGGGLFVNIQADNFGLPATVLDRVITAMTAERGIGCATLARKITADPDLFDPNRVKVIMSPENEALWFSRLPLPYLQGAPQRRRTGRFPFWEHLGIYFFRPRLLAAFAACRRTPLERAESLEQLRLLENGYSIRIFKTRARSVSVDSVADLRKLDPIYL
jgi:3-deoxy-manno-octulosonate cytidylyltransferase (CMP-KDO synthetase)